MVGSDVVVYDLTVRSTENNVKNVVHIVCSLKQYQNTVFINQIADVVFTAKHLPVSLVNPRQN